MASRTVMLVTVEDYIAALKLSKELAALVFAIGKGEVSDQAASRAARALSVSLTKRLAGMQVEPPRLKDIVG